LAAAACGRGEEEYPPIIEMPWRQAPPPLPRETDRPTVPIPGFIAADREEVTVDFWYVSSGNTQSDALRETLVSFHDSQPYVRVNEVAYGSYALLAAQIMLSDFAGTLPHVAVASPPDVTRYRAERMLLPLSSFMYDPVVGMQTGEIEDILPALRPVGIYDGLWYSIPFTASVRLLFYNRDLITSHGFIRAPETWADMEQAARALTDESGRRGIGFGNDIDTEWLTLFIRLGGTFFNETDTRAAFASFEGIRSMQNLAVMANGPYARVIGDGENINTTFARGEIAMFFGWSADIPHVANAVGDAFDWRTAPVPASQDSRAAELTGYGLVMFENISHGVDERVGAWEFIRFTLGADVAALWAIANHSVPVTQAALESLAYSRFFNLNPPARGIFASADSGFFRTRHISDDGIRGILSDSVNSIINGGVSAEVGLTQAEEKINLMLEGR